MKRRYAEYRDSGVDWLGEVPSHWVACLTKRAITVRSGDMISATEETESGFPIIGGNGVRAFTDKVNSAADTLVIGRVGANCGCVHHIADSFWASEHCYRVIEKVPLSKRFFFHLLGFLNLNQFAIKTAQPLLNTEIVETQWIALPPLPEQTAIAAFLDRETAKIDGLIEQQRRLIDLLREKRQAVISHAVTRGLNPKAPLKPSGIDWLGNVPEGWEVKRLRHVSRMNPSKSEIGTIEKDAEVSFLPMEAVGEDGSLDLSKRRPFGEVENGYTYFRDGDVTYAKITPCFENGKGALMAGLDNSFGFGTTELTVLRPKQDSILPEYLFCVVSSPAFLKIGEGYMYGAGGQKRVPDDFARDFSAAIPPLPEQAEIVAHIVAMKAKFDTLTTTAENAIALLQERRTALISAVVTGKIDVRDLVKKTEAA